MKQAQLIYESNRQAINFLLIEKGYPPTFCGLIKAIKEIGDGFLVEMYNEVTASFDEAGGNFWTKFKNIFHSAVDIINKTDKVTGSVDKFMNPDTQTATKTDKITSAVDTWKPDLIWWGAGAAAVIVILVLVYIFKK